MNKIATLATKTHNVTLLVDSKNTNSKGEKFYKVIAVDYEDGSCTSVNFRSKQLDADIVKKIQGAYPTSGGEFVAILK